MSDIKKMRLLNAPFERAKNIPHSEFVKKVKSGQIKFDVMVKNKYKVLPKSYRYIFFFLYYCIHQFHLY